MYLHLLKLKMLTLKELLNEVSPRNWFTLIDLMDVYFYVAIHLVHMQFLWFAFEGTAYKSLVLLSGLSLAPSRNLLRWHSFLIH